MALSSTLNQHSTDYTLITPNSNTPPSNITINSFTFTTDHFINDILLLKPHIDIEPHTNALDLLKNIFTTYQIPKNFSSDLGHIQEILQYNNVPSFAPSTSN